MCCARFCTYTNPELRRIILGEDLLLEWSLRFLIALMLSNVKKRAWMKFENGPSPSICYMWHHGNKNRHPASCQLEGVATGWSGDFWEVLAIYFAIVSLDLCSEWDGLSFKGVYPRHCDHLDMTQTLDSQNGRLGSDDLIVIIISGVFVDLSSLFVLVSQQNTISILKVYFDPLFMTPSLH